MSLNLTTPFFTSSVLLEDERLLRNWHLEQFRNLGIDFVSYQENIDTNSPLGSAIFTIISAAAQLERAIIAERVKAGLKRARDNRKQLGRPRVAIDRNELVRLRSKGMRQEP